MAPPPADTYKINNDASFSKSTSTGGWGFVARDINGSFLEGACGNLQRLSSALQGEALAAFFSLKRAAESGISRIILETDALELKRAITSDILDRSMDGCSFQQLRNLMNSAFDSCIVRHCPRSCNVWGECG